VPVWVAGGGDDGGGVGVGVGDGVCMPFDPGAAEPADACWEPPSCDAITD
jgi:hypothetical protein